MLVKHLKLPPRLNLLHDLVEKGWLKSSTILLARRFLILAPNRGDKYKTNERAIKDADQREDSRFSMQEKRELLDLLNEKARKHHDSVSLVAEALGKTAEVKDTCDVSLFYLILHSDV